MQWIKRTQCACTCAVHTLRIRCACAGHALGMHTAAAAAARARARALLIQLAPDQQLLAAVWCEDGELRGSVALPQKVRGERRDEAGLVRVGARLSLGLEGLGLSWGKRVVSEGLGV